MLSQNCDHNPSVTVRGSKSPSFEEEAEGREPDTFLQGPLGGARPPRPPPVTTSIQGAEVGRGMVAVYVRSPEMFRVVSLVGSDGRAPGKRGLPSSPG